MTRSRIQTSVSTLIEVFRRADTKHGTVPRKFGLPPSAEVVVTDRMEPILLKGGGTVKPEGWAAGVSDPTQKAPAEHRWLRLWAKVNPGSREPACTPYL
jgi:hypothetical protein